MVKNCSTCKLEKPVDFFCVNKIKTNGDIKRHTKCNQCRNKVNLLRIHKLGISTPRLLSEPISGITVNERNRLWRKANPEKWKAANRLNRHRRRALGAINTSEWLSKLTFFNNECQSCFKREPDVKITIDHIIPISKGGTNVIENLQPLCMRCNQTKHAKCPTQYSKLVLTK